jgi:hypothetical protein
MLANKTVKELRDMAKELGIKGRWEMIKPVLIMKIIDATESINNTTLRVNGEETKTETDTKVKEVELISKDTVIKEEKQTENTKIDNYDVENRLHYVDKAPIGTLVAFKIKEEKDKYCSAKIVNKSTKKQVLKVETKRGFIYIIPYTDIVWVKTGKRWPSGVFDMLTGGKRYGKSISSRK